MSVTKIDKMDSLGVFLLSCCILTNVSSIVSTGCQDNCYKQLGGESHFITFSCQDSDIRNTSDFIWMRDGTVLEVDNDKYIATSNSLKINDIVYTDEGNYTCTYGTTMNPNVTHDAGCLLVYGAASFRNENENMIYVAYDGTISFEMILSFSSPGSCGLMEKIHRYILKNISNTVLVDCVRESCAFNGADHNQWWTVETNTENKIMAFTLHQAKSSDRTRYMAQVEGTDVSTDIPRRIEKVVDVKGLECDAPYPSVNNGSVELLEPDTIDIIGAQANYSCNNTCIIHGSKSLRCNITLAGSKWVNEMGEMDLPSCSCPSSSFFSALITSTSTILPTNMSTSLVISPNNKSTNSGIQELHLGIAIAAPLFVAINSVFLIIILCYRQYRTKVAASHRSPEQSETKVINVDTSRYSTALDGDGNPDNDIDFDNSKNSYAAIV